MASAPPFISFFSYDIFATSEMPLFWLGMRNNMRCCYALHTHRTNFSKFCSQMESIIWSKELLFLKDFSTKWHFWNCWHYWHVWQFWHFLHSWHSWHYCNFWHSWHFWYFWYFWHFWHIWQLILLKKLQKHWTKFLKLNIFTNRINIRSYNGCF